MKPLPSVWAGIVVVAAGCASATSPVTLMHPGGSIVSPAPVVTARPFAVAISSTGVAYIGRQDVPYLQRTALPDITFPNSVRVGSDPSDIAFNTSGSTAYVTNQFSGTVGVIDVQRGISIDSIAVSGAPFRVLVSPDDATIFVSSNDDSVFAIARSSKTVVHAWRFNAPVNGMTVASTGAALYASTIGGELYRLNPNGTGSVDSVQIGGKPQDVALSPDGTELYLANEAGSLEIRNPVSLAFVDSVPGAAGAFSLKPTPDGVQLYASYPASGLVRIVDRATRKVVGNLTVAGTPRRIAFDRRGETALIANESGYVTVVR